MWDYEYTYWILKSWKLYIHRKALLDTCETRCKKSRIFFRMALDFQCSFQVPAFVVAILAWITSWVALLTPAWQVVYVRELQQWIQSGLWLNCQTRPSGMYTCTYTFSESDFNFYTSAEIVDWRTPPFYSWQRRLLAVYLGAQMAAFVALVSFCCSLQAAGRRMSSLIFVGAIAVSCKFICSFGYLT